jgi:hypothetical protein
MPPPLPPFPEHYNNGNVKDDSRGHDNDKDNDKDDRGPIRTRTATRMERERLILLVRTEAKQCEQERTLVPNHLANLHTTSIDVGAAFARSAG